MSAIQRRQRAAQARTWIDRAASDQHRWGVAVSQLLLALDRECQRKLNAGRRDLFGSIADLRAEWLAAIAEWPHVPGEDEAELHQEIFAAALEHMRRNGDLVLANDRQRARSRTFETVFYLRSLRQRTNRNANIMSAPHLVEMVKAEVKSRIRPDRNQSVSELRDALDRGAFAIDSSYLAEYSNPTALVELVPWALDIFDDFMQRAFGSALSLAGFQVAAAEQILTAALGAGGVESGTVIAAGTGFGKTEAFLFPTLFYALLNKAVREQAAKPGAAALLVYPRRDLCNDQATRLLGYLSHLNEAMRSRWVEQMGGIPFSPIRLALAHGGFAEEMRIACPLCAADKRQDPNTWSTADEDSAWLIAQPAQGDRNFKGLFSCRRRGQLHSAAASAIAYQVHRDGDDVDIVVTNLDTLHRRLMDNHGRTRLFRSSAIPVRLVVIDEMHIYEGQTGTHAANIVRRLRQRIKAMGAGPVVIGASATVHDPADLLYRLSGLPTTSMEVVEPEDADVLSHGLEYFIFAQAPGNRLIGAPNVDDTDDPQNGLSPPGQSGRFVSEQATMIQAAMCLQHTMKAPGGAPNQKRRVLGFVDSLDVAARLARNLDNAEWQDAWPNGNQSGTMSRTPLYTLRGAFGRGDSQNDIAQAIGDAADEVRPGLAPAQAFGLPLSDCPRHRQGNCEIPPHHLQARCSRYESGECWHSMGKVGEETFRPIVVQKHQSGRRDWAFPPLRYESGRDSQQWRLLVTTSALEVGFDHPELIATWQYHAPPSVAGFLQRKGRGGRGVSDRPITMMVLGASDADIFAFQHHDRYVNVDESRDLVCWVDPDNEALQRQHIVAALFDFCASVGEQQAYTMVKLDRLDHVLRTRRSGAVNWVRGCFPRLTYSGAEKAIEDVEQELRQRWIGPVVPADIPWVERSAAVLFKQLNDGDLRARASQLSGRSDPDAVQTRELLLALATVRGPVKTAPDFFAALPSGWTEDRDLRIPKSTIPEPLGLDVTLFKDSDGAEIGRDPAEFALNAFLPGGFKIRFDGRLWAAPWSPPPGYAALNNAAISRAVLRVASPQARTDGAIPDLVTREEIRSVIDVLTRDSDLDAQRRDELVAQYGMDAQLAIVSGLYLHDLGRPVTRSFVLVTQTMAVRYSAADAVGTTQRLTRDPHLTPQKTFIPLRSKRSGPPRDIEPFTNIRFNRHQEILVLHHANLVHTYPQGGGEQTVAVHFRAAGDLARPLIPGIRMRTEAIEFTVGDHPDNWSRASKSRAFWRRVGELLAEVLVVERGLLPSFYGVEGCLDALAALEPKVGAFADRPPDGDTLTALIGENVGWLDELTVLLPHAGAVAEILARAAAWVGSGVGRGRAAADTLAAALVRAAAADLRLSPHALRTLVEPISGSWRILVFDDNEGGSGNARRLNEQLERWSSLRQRLEAQLACPIAAGDRIVDAVLASGRSADALAMLRVTDALDTLAPIGLEPAVRRRLERMFEGSEIAAFHLYAYQVLQSTIREYEAIPPLRRLVRQVLRTPAFDPRAAVLKKDFRGASGLELASRLRAIMPLCEAGCPYCIGNAGSSFADRTLLADQ